MIERFERAVVLSFLLIVVGGMALVMTDTYTRAQVITPGEVVTLTSPIAPPPQTTCSLFDMHIFFSVVDPSQARIIVNVKGEHGETLANSPKVYDQASSPTAQTLLGLLNRSNNSGANPSMVKRIYSQLTTDGVCPAGSVTGTPQ